MHFFCDIKSVESVFIQDWHPSNFCWMFDLFSARGSEIEKINHGHRKTKQKSTLKVERGEEKDTKTDKQKSLTIWKWKCPQTSFYLSRLWSKYKQIAFWTSGALEGALCWRSCNEVATAPSGRVNPQNPLQQTHCQQPRGKYETQFARSTLTHLHFQRSLCKTLLSWQLY